MRPALVILAFFFVLPTARAGDCPGLTNLPSFARALRADPLGTFERLEAEGPRLASPGFAPLGRKIAADLEERLAADSVLALPLFRDVRRKLFGLREEFEIIQNLGYPYDRTNRAVVAWVETMSRLFRAYDPSLTGDYHREFARGIQDDVLSSDDGTRVFFDDESVGDLYFWDIRASATYLQWVFDFPPFASRVDTYRGGPLADPARLLSYIDGLHLDPEEILKHDVGHSFLMKRQDRYLFQTLDQPRGELVAEWVANQKALRARYDELRGRDRELGRAVKFLITELVHERGYQFFWPILYQQIRSEKWIEILRFKMGNRYWAKDGLTEPEFARMKEARRWLELEIRDMARTASAEKLARHRAERANVLMKRWHPVRTYEGTPLKIEIRGPRDIKVVMDVPGQDVKVTSLYEVASVLGEPSSLDGAEEIANLETHRAGLSPIETYKLARVLTMIRRKTSAKFSHTRPPDELIGRVERRDGHRIRFLEPSGRRHDLDLAEVSFQREPFVPKDPPSKYVNLDPGARFVEETVLREAYEHYDQSLNPGAPPYVELRNASGEYELAMVDMNDMRVATAVSSLLTRSLEDAMYTNGGYLPPDIVRRVQKEIISPYGISQLWGRVGRRFVLSRAAGPGLREVVGSVLIAESRDNIFFFTSRFNNLKQSRLAETIDRGDRWLEKFDFPDVARYKPSGYHHFANFVVEKEGMRGLGVAQLMLDGIVRKYARGFLEATGDPVVHSQRLLCGSGFWQIGDPPWLARMSKLGFTRRLGAESFHMDVPWDPLIPTYDAEGRVIEHVAYNASFGMPRLYEGGPHAEDYSGDPMPERIPHVVALARSGRAKIQYFQLLYPFHRTIERVLAERGLK